MVNGTNSSSLSMSGMTTAKRLARRMRGWVTSWESAPTTNKGRLLTVAAVWSPFLIPPAVYGLKLTSGETRDLFASALLVLVIVSTLAVVGLATCMILFAQAVP